MSGLLGCPYHWHFPRDGTLEFESLATAGEFSFDLMRVADLHLITQSLPPWF